MKKKISKLNKNPLAKLLPILEDGEVNEILIDAPDRVLVDRKGKLVQADVKFASAHELRATVDAVLALGGEKFEAGQTMADTRLSDGSRVFAVIPPTAVDSPYLIIRKFFTRGMTWQKLLDFGALDQPTLELLQSAVNARQNILVVGGTGSGKTTVLNLLAESVDKEERLIVIGEKGDLPVTHPRRLHLEPNRNTSLSELYIAASRMRPERIISTEFRGAEAIHALQLASTGHDGSMMSIHANNAEDALARLEGMCLMADLGLGLSEIRTLIAATFGLITCQGRLPNGQRKLNAIVELRGVEHDRYVLQPLMHYDETHDKFEILNVKPSWQK